MSIRDMRIGDTIIGTDARTYEVVSKSIDRVKAREHDNLRHTKTFKGDELVCVDFDDGLWQQTVPEP